jgi:hypothetical protein
MKVCTAHPIVESERLVTREAHPVSCPVLALHGTSNMSSLVTGFEVFLVAYCSQDKSLWTRLQGRHNLLNDPEKVWEVVIV